MTAVETCGAGPSAAKHVTDMQAQPGRHLDPAHAPAGGLLAGDELPQHDAEGVDVHRRRAGLPHQHLGRLRTRCESDDTMDRIHETCLVA